MPRELGVAQDRPALREVLEEVLGEGGDVASRRALPRVGEAVGVGEHGVAQAHPPGLRVHPLDEQLLAPREVLGDGLRRVVGRRDADPLQENLEGHGLPGDQPHPEARGAHRGVADADGLREGDLPRPEIVVRDVEGHQLDEAGRSAVTLGVLRVEDLAGGEIDEEPGLRGD